MLAIEIDEQARPGRVDILIEVDGEAFLVASALEVFEAGSGHGAAEQDEDGFAETDTGCD